MANIGPESDKTNLPRLWVQRCCKSRSRSSTLESTLSSARPFSPTSTGSYRHSRPAVPSSLGMGVGARGLPCCYIPAQPSLLIPNWTDKGIASIATSSTRSRILFGACAMLSTTPTQKPDRCSSMVAPPQVSAVSTGQGPTNQRPLPLHKNAIDIGQDHTHNSDYAAGATGYS